MKVTDVGAAYDKQFERVEMSNLDKVFERNRITKQGIDAMITNYLRLECKLAEVKEQLRLCNVDQFTTAAELAEANARLDWLDTVECGIQHRSYGEYWHYIGKGFPKAREVIDAAMKEGK